MAYQLSLVEADILGQTLDVDIRQFPFDIPSHGQFQVERQRLAREVFLGLNRRGLMRYGDLDPELSRSLRTLANYSVTVSVMGTVEKTRELYARAAANGETGVLLIKDAQGLKVDPIRPTALATSLVGLLPKLEAGPGQSVSITQTTQLTRQLDDDFMMLPAQASRNGNEQQLRIAASYLSRPRTGTGMFTVTGRDRRTGRELRAGTLTWIDTEDGRYLALSRPPGEDGQTRTTFSPTDSPRLTQQLGEMIESVTPRR